MKNFLNRAFLKRHHAMLVNCLPAVSLFACVPFFWTSLWWVSCFALVPYIYFVLDKARRNDTEHLVSITWLYGLFYLLLVCSWLIRADAQSWTQLGGFSLEYIVFVIWFLLGLFLSLGFVLLGYILKFFIKRGASQQKLLLVIPLAWVVCEYFRSLLFSVASLGSGSTIGAFWNFGALGYGVATSHLLFLSRLGGLFGVSLAVVALNVAIVLAIKRSWWSAVIVAGVVVLTAVSMATSGATSRTFSATTVQLASTDVNYYHNLDEMLNTRPPKADILVMPEYGYFLEYGTDAQHHSILDKIFQGNKGAVVYSRRGPLLNNKQTNELVAADQNAQIVDAQIKSFIIPTGEYIPYLVLAILRAMGQGMAQTYFDTSVGVTASPKLEHPFRVNDMTIASLACSGVIAADHYRTLVAQGGEVITNSASLNEFANAALYHEQARQFARFLAVSNDRPYVQSARGGFAYIIGGDGKLLYNSREPGLKLGNATVETTKTKTLYTRFGEWVIMVATIALIGLVVANMRPKRS